MTFTLSGFNTVKREGIELTGDFTAPVNAELKVGGDRRDDYRVRRRARSSTRRACTQKKSLTSEMIDALPTGRSFQNLSVLVPGVHDRPGQPGRRRHGR